MLGARGDGLLLQRRDQFVALVHELLPWTTARRRPHRVLAEQRKRDRGINIRDGCIGKYTRIDLPPAYGFGRGRAGQSSPDHLISSDLNEEVVAALRDAIDLP